MEPQKLVLYLVLAVIVGFGAIWIHTPGPALAMRPLSFPTTITASVR